MTKEDIDTIVELAEASDQFKAGKKLEDLRERSDHWRELYDTIVDNHSSLVEEIKTLVNCN